MDIEGQIMPSMNEIRQENTIEPGSQSPDLMEVIYGDEDFVPTPLQCKLLLAFVKDSEERQPKEVLKEELGSGMNLWYMWRKGSPGFIKWWNSCLAAIYSGFGVPEVWSAVKKRAIRHSDAAAKLFIERYDAQYKPSTSQEHLHSFAGYQPTETTAELAERSRERERKVIDSKEIEDEM